MIPADLSARLRMLTEASFFSKEPPEVGALRSAREIPEELPEFAAGQRITASLREARTDESFRALIAGKEFTLLLPKSLGARAGQTLELIVAQSTPRGVLANVAPSDTAGVSTSLSQTARLIGVLLTGQPPAAAARLAAGQPLMPSPTGAGHVRGQQDPSRGHPRHRAEDALQQAQRAAG